MNVYEKRGPGAGLLAGLFLLALGISSAVNAVEWRCAPGDLSGWDENWNKIIGISSAIPDVDKRCDALLQNAPEDQIQVVIFPTGFAASEKDIFFEEAEEFRLGVSEDWSFNDLIFTQKYKHQFMYVAVWIESTPVGDDDALFSSKIGSENIGRLLMNDKEAFDKVNDIRGEHIFFNPANIAVIFNESGRANATLPNRKDGQLMGVSRTSFSSDDHTKMHEMGHSYMGWQDEYTEFLENAQGQDMPIDIRSLDWLTFLGLWTFPTDESSTATPLSALLNVYDINFSEIYTAGSDNVSPSICPATVGQYSLCGDPNYPYHHDYYAFDGSGPFTGLFKENSDSLMTSSWYQSDSQDRVMATAFSGVPGRPNDRIRNAGPLGLVDLAKKVDSPTQEEYISLILLAYDEDKFHTWQPTLEYEVEIHYQERVSDTCYFFGIPYVCTKLVDAEGVGFTFEPTLQTINYENSALKLIADFVSSVSGNVGNVISEFTEALDGTNIPYQPFVVEVPDGGENYKWRFRTRNGSKVGECGDACSGWTNYTYFYNFD